MDKKIRCPYCKTHNVKLIRKYATVHVYQCKNGDRKAGCGRKFQVDAGYSDAIRNRK